MHFLHRHVRHKKRAAKGTLRLGEYRRNFMTKKDYYSVLGVRRDASDKEIKQTYRRLARQYHPDVNPGDASAEQKFKEISEAYAVLSNPDSRKKYDRFGHQAFATGFDPGFARGGCFCAGQHGDFTDICCC